MSKHHLELENKIKKLKSENDEELKHRIETAIALAKVDWFAVSRHFSMRGYFDRMRPFCTVEALLTDTYILSSG